jgi:ankyrin repeat protein
MNIVKNKKKLSQCIQSIKTHNHTPFIINTDYKNDSLYKILSKNPSLINKKDNKNETLLSYSIKRNNIDNFNLILTSPNLDLNYQNKEGNSYLHIAILFEREEMIKTLIKKGININMKNNEGNTPLHIAYNVGNKNIINELIRNNIDLRIKNKYGLIGYENKKKKIKKSNCEINSFNKCKSNYKINIFENKNKSNCEILKPHIKEINNDKNKKINLKMFKIQKSILYKKKGDNLTEETKSNSPPNTNNSYRSNNYKIYDYNHNYENIYSLTSSHEIQKKISKNSNELNIISNANFSNSSLNYYNFNNNSCNYNNKNNYIIEDDDLSNININKQIKKPSMKKYKTSVLFNLNNNENPINNNDNSNYNKLYYDTIKKKRPINQSQRNFYYFSPIAIHQQIYKKKSYKQLIVTENERLLKKSLPNIKKVLVSNFDLNTSFNNNNDNSNNLNNEDYNILYKNENNINKVNIFNESLTENNLLYDFLSKIKMEKYYKNLTLNGFDDIKLIIEQTKKNELGITNENLKEAGILLFGDRIKIIIRVQELSNNFPYLIPKEVYYICENLINADVDKNILKLNKWLKSINIENFLNNFISNGFHSLELLLIQNYSKEPLTIENLKNELGIEKIGFRQRIINKLKDDSKKFVNKLKTNLLIVEEGKNKEICNKCTIF